MVRFLCFLLTIGMLAHGSEREKDVYAIYSLMLTNPDTSFGEDTNERYLIAAVTIAPPRQQPCVRPPEEREPDFREVLADYERRKTTPRLLTRRLSIPKPYELLSESDVKAFEQERAVPGTQVPDAKFRGVRNLFYVTEVYFNKRRTMALTRIYTLCGNMCAMDQWKVFEKLDSGQWQERPWVTCWTMSRRVYKDLCKRSPHQTRRTEWKSRRN
jgi:hypothetical protein